MAEGKKSFVLYRDLIHTVEKLPSEVAGELFKHILRYVNDLSPETDNLLVEIAFEPIRWQLKRDLEKYQAIVDRNRRNGQKGGAPRKPPKAPKKPSGIKEEPKKADNDTDIDTDTVTHTETGTDIIKTVHSEEVHRVYESCLGYFDKHLWPTNKKSQDKWRSEIDKLNRIDKIPFDNILEIVKRTREDKFWSKNFQSILKLRRTNPDGLKYIVVFNEQTKNNGNQKPQYETAEQLTDSAKRIALKLSQTN